MIVTEEHQIKRTHEFWKECDRLCFISKNLYNASLYLIRQHYFATNSFKDSNGPLFSNTTLYHALKDSDEFRTTLHQEYNGYQTNTKVLKQTFIQINREFSSFFKAIKSYQKNPKKFTGRPKLPKYKDKVKGRNVVTFPKDALSFKKRDGHIHLSMTDIYIKPYRADNNSVKEVKVVPNTNSYSIFVSYEIDEKAISATHTRICGIDLGLNNLATLSSNDTRLKPVIVNGKPIKSINQYYNKKKANLQSQLPQGRMSSNAIRALTHKRNNKVKDYMHKASKYIVDYLVENNATCLVVGSNNQWKNSIRIGKINNQNFVSIPYHKFKWMLKYKCALAGIEYIETEESYTSKCSFLDMEEMCNQDDVGYRGKRVSRGMFVSGSGRRINADLNGSLNIIRKVAGDDMFVYTDVSYLVEGYAVSPMRVSL